jgi:positive regulator of sigma E activity
MLFSPKGLPLNTGQTVQVRASPLSLLGQASAALLPPAFGFGASFFLTPLLFPEAGEGAVIGLSLAFLFATAFVIYMIRKKFPAKRVYTVTKIIA